MRRAESWVTRAARSRRGLTMTMFVAAAFAFAWPIQEPGWTQKAHYALVRSLADGTARIDSYHLETGDKGYWEGHFYSVKAPGLAVVSLPAYMALDAVGAVPDDDRTAIWLLNLLTVVPFALVLVALTKRLAERIGQRAWFVGAVVAVATIVLPFSTLYFSHVPTAALAMAALYLALRSRESGSARDGALAGAAAGLGVFFEYPTAVIALALAVFLAITGTDRLRACAGYLAGLVLGLLPLVAYNTWAFGSPTHLSYRDVIEPSDWQSANPALLPQESFGLSQPSLQALADLILSERGLLTATPVLAAGVAGLVLLARSGRLAEALLIALTSAAALLWNSGFTTAYGGPFGGDSPGARYLIAIVPWLVLPVGLAAVRAPGATLGLAVIAVGIMTVVTATRPQVGPDETGEWWSRLGDGAFTETPLTLAGLDNGWISIAPFFVAVTVVAAVGLVRVSRSVDRRELVWCSLAILAWGLVFVGAPELLRTPGGSSGALLALGLACVAAAAVVGSMRWGHS